MTIVAQKWTTVIYLGVALIWSANAYQIFHQGNKIWASILAFSVVIYLILRFRHYRQVWEITKAGKTFKVVRNRKVFFEGKSMDLASVETDHFNHFIHPLNRPMIQVPQKAANKIFLDLIKSKDRKELSS